MFSLMYEVTCEGKFSVKCLKKKYVLKSLGYPYNLAASFGKNLSIYSISLDVLNSKKPFLDISSLIFFCIKNYDWELYIDLNIMIFTEDILKENKDETMNFGLLVQISTNLEWSIFIYHKSKSCKVCDVWTGRDEAHVPMLLETYNHFVTIFCSI